MRKALYRALPLTCPVLLLCLCLAAAAQGTDGTNGAKPTNDLSAETQQQLRAYLQLQEQLHAAVMAIEQNRQESTASVQRNSELLSTRLKLIEQALSTQREREVDATQKSNRMVLVTAAVFGAVGLLAMMVTAFFLFRSMNRLAEISAVPKGLTLANGGPAIAALGPGENVIPLSPESSRLLSTIERLEKRVHELEAGMSPQLLAMAKDHAIGDLRQNDLGNADAATLDTADIVHSGEDRLSLILGKGQTLLNLGQAENALVCFDEVLEASPDHPEALVKKGTALERLKRWEEALGCYDRAIAADSGMTLAYLYKGGVFNQLERFSEALECYELALRTQQKSAIPA